MTQRKPKSQHKKDGRPTVMTPDTLQKLEDAFLNAFTDEMACLYAGISEATLYSYCQENPKFAERKEKLKLTPNLAAQKRLVDDAAGSVGGARWWAERRMPEFMPKTKVEHGGKIATEDVNQTAATQAVKEKYEKELRETIAAGVTKKPA